MSIAEELEQHLAQMSANDPETMRDLRSAISGAKWMAERLASEARANQTDSVSYATICSFKRGLTSTKEI